MPSAAGLLALPSSTLGGAAPNAPTSPYGQDWSCTTDVDGGGAEVSGIDCLSQALFRRLITPRGQLIDDPNYGFDLTQFLNADFVMDSNVTQGDLARIAHGVDTEMKKDERVFQSATAISLAFVGGVQTLNLVTQITPLAGPSFKLVVAATALTVQLLQVSQ